MDKIYKILSNLREGIPQALSRYNDGEVQGIVQPGCTVARGDQKVSQDLSDALREAIQYQQENYWVGIPCDQCNTAKWYRHAIKLVDPNYKYLTKAVVTTNRNWKLFKDTIPEIIRDSTARVHWVSGVDQNIRKLGFRVDTHIQLPVKNAWSKYEEIKNWGKDFQRGAIVFFSCGPLARVLARQWFQQNPEATFLDVGSAFDPFTRGVLHACHRGTLAPCKGCN